jgi:lysophospholipase L1-like esterase
VRFWLQTLALLGAVLVAFEVLCRLLIGHAPATRFDPHYDRLPRPDQPVVQSSEGWSRARTNELGHLDRAMPSPPPPDGILVVGDSFTEARQVAMAERFTDRLGEWLHRRVYNVGHTGWSPIHALSFVAAERARFAPATVIVQISGNDFEDLITAKRPHVERTPSGLAIVWPRRDKHGTAKRITQLRETVERSALAGDAMTALLTLFKGTAAVDEGGESGNQTICEKPDPLVAEAIPWLFGELKKTHPDVRLLYLPMLDYHAGCIDRCAAGRALYAAAAAGQGLRMVDVTPALCARFAQTRQPLHGFWNTVPGTGHLNAEGHAVVARQLADELRAVPSPDVR